MNPKNVGYIRTIAMMICMQIFTLAALKLVVNVLLKEEKLEQAEMKEEKEDKEEQPRDPRMSVKGVLIVISACKMSGTCLLKGLVTIMEKTGATIPLKKSTFNNCTTAVLKLVGFVHLLNNPLEGEMKEEKL